MNRFHARKRVPVHIVESTKPPLAILLLALDHDESANDDNNVLVR
jgi:hypothetical protein